MIRVIRNGTVVTMNKNKTIKVCDVVIKDNLIMEICDKYSGSFDEEIDATNKVVIPGLVNCHMHMGMSVFRGTNDGLDLMNWLDMILPLEDKLSGKDMYYSTLLTCIEMIKTGTTCGSDMYFNWKEVLPAIKKSNIRCVYSRCINDADGKLEYRVNDFEELVKYNNEFPNELITLSVTPHSLYTCSRECLLKCKELADKYNLLLHIHFCENREEVKTIENKFNMKPIKVLESLGYLDNNLLLAHAVHLEDENLDLLNRRNIFISHNILSNLNLGCGILPYKKYKEHNLNIALGTDGQGSGENVDMFNTMQLTSLVSKGTYEDPKYTDSYDILESATIKGAEALLLDDKIGSIEVGKCADLLILDLNNIDIFPTINLINQIVHNVKPSNIEYSIINGKIVMKNGALCLDIDEIELRKEILNIISKLGLTKKQSK